MRPIFFIFIFVVLSLFNAAQAQKETREPFQHPKLGEVLLVKEYKKDTDTIDLEYYEKTVTITDPIFGEMTAVNEYEKDGELFSQTRYKKNYNDPELGIVNIEQEFYDGDIYNNYRIKKNHKDPELGIVDVIISFDYDGLATTYKIKNSKKEDPNLGTVKTTVSYEEDVKYNETISYGSTTIEKTFYNGKLKAEKKEYLDENNHHRTEELKYSGRDFPEEILNYKNGKRDGVQKYFSYDGKLKREINYQDGVKIGVQNTYHYSGKLEKTETINGNGKLEGDYLKYFSDGSLKIKGSYKNGEKIGAWEHYDESYEPNLIKKCVYDEDSTVCEEVDYYDHGGYFTAKSFTTFVQKKEDRSRYREGPFTSYHNYEKKLIKEKGAYKNGQQFGPWVIKDADGNTTCNVTYLDDKQIKDQTFAYYSQEGVKTGEGSNISHAICGGETVHKGEGYENRFDQGKPSSEKKYIDDELVADTLYKYGVLTFERKFKDGERIAVTGYDKKGRISYKWELINDATFLEEFDYEANIHDSGFIPEKPAATMMLSRKISYDTGEVLAKGNVEKTSKKINGFSTPDISFSKTGVWKTYYKNGGLKTEGEYRNNEPVGLWVKYDEGGGVIEEIEKGAGS